MFELILKRIFSKGIDTVWENRSMISLYLKTLFGKYRNKEIRFSISYLFKIRIPDTDKYLLVLNRRINNQLQPVGGVYKRYGDDKLFEKWGYQIDNNNNGLGCDERSNGDLRFRVQGKNVIKVIKWFEEGKEREVSAQREFVEELLDTKILSPDQFRSISYRHTGRFSKHLCYSEFHQCYEVLIYDVMELLPNKEQEKALIELTKAKNDLRNGYVIVSSESISQLRYVEEGVQLAKIGEHTRLLINQKF